MCAKQVAEGVSLDDHEEWMSGGGYQAVGEAEKEEGCGRRGGCDGMEEKSSYKLLSVGGAKGIGRWWMNRIGGHWPRG